jgi:hypothetical protein
MLPNWMLYFFVIADMLKQRAAMAAEASLYRRASERGKRAYATGQREKDHYSVHPEYPEEVYGRKPHHDAAGDRG